MPEMLNKYGLVQCAIFIKTSDLKKMEPRIRKYFILLTVKLHLYITAEQK